MVLTSHFFACLIGRGSKIDPRKKRTPRKEFFHHWRVLSLSHHSTKFGCHTSSESGDKNFIKCPNVAHVIEGPCDFIGGSPSCLITICHVTSQHHVIKGLYDFIFGNS